MTKARDLANASTALSAVSATELAFVDGVTSAIQTQMDAKAPSSTAVTLTGTQTLTNKTLTSPALTTPTISTATTNGDILYGTGSGALARLGVGSTAQVLTVAAGVPSWATPAGGGKILQVQFFTLNGPSAVVSTSSTYASTTVTQNITPSSTSSKIIILASLCLANNPGTTGNSGVGLRLKRNSTVINLMGVSNLSDQLSGVKYGQGSFTYLDSPATTSAVTYTIEFARTTAGTVYINGDGGTNDSSNILLMEVGP